MGPNLSQSWTGFTKFTTLNGKPPEGYMWSGRGLTIIQATTRLDHLWPEMWSGMSKQLNERKKQQWPIEKPTLDIARKLRGIYFIDPDDGELKVTTQKKRTEKVGDSDGSGYAL